MILKAKKMPYNFWTKLENSGHSEDASTVAQCLELSIEMSEN